MPLDLEKEAAESGCTLTALERWTHGGHEVALVRYEKKDADPPYADTHLVCECDFAWEDVVDGGKVVGRTHPKDPHDCRDKKAVMRKVRDAAGADCRAAAADKGLKAAILDIHAKVRAGTYLGQAYASMIYVQEVAELLGLTPREVLVAVDELFAAEKLDLNGMILIPYEARFRFPKEVQTMLRLLVEEPLGYPNGDAGDCFLATIEGAVHEHTPYKSGKSAFWEHNFPHLAPNYLTRFGCWFLAAAHERALRDAEARKDIGDPAEIAGKLRELAAKYDALAKPPTPPKRRGRKKTR